MYQGSPRFPVFRALSRKTDNDQRVESKTKNILLLKPVAQAQVGKTKLFINCFRNPQAPATQKAGKSTTQGSNQRLTAPLNPSIVPCQTQCRKGHSTLEPGQAGNTLQIVTVYTLILQALMDELRRSSGMSNSGRSR